MPSAEKSALSPNTVSIQLNENRLFKCYFYKSAIMKKKKANLEQIL